MSERPATQALRQRLQAHLRAIYPGCGPQPLVEELIGIFGLDKRCERPRRTRNNWTQSDILVITYGNTVTAPDERPLATLTRFLTERLQGAISGVHVLPFCPSSSDDGFSVIDYLAVDPSLGNWGDIEKLAGQFKLMADLVINHASSRSQWFENFKKRADPGKDYFVEASPTGDLSQAVRPRNSPLLQEVETADGPRFVWCTFSFDQIDLDFKNPRVLMEFARIIRAYMDHGVRIFRLDAVAFLWKEPGTPCLHLRQTHEIVRLLRTLIEHRDPAAIIVTETNVPNRENLTYFGNANEAHAIYNFSLPPLLLYTLLSGDCQHLKTWMMSMPPPRFGTAYLNFLASHDGIGLRPAEGLLTGEETDAFIRTLAGFGGRIGLRRLPDGSDKPYEINITMWDAMKGALGGKPDGWQLERFLCAHTIMLGLEGIPAFYINSLLAAENDYAKLERTGQNRAIHRRQWDCQTLTNLLDDPWTHHSKVFNEMKRRIGIRRRQPTFHPNATQYTLHLGNEIFGFWRQSMNREQSVFALHNVTGRPQDVSLDEINLIETDDWADLIGGGRVISFEGTIRLEPYQSVWLSNQF